MHIATGAVELVYFRGEFEESPTSIMLTWETSFESRTAGYMIKRKLADSDQPAVEISVILGGASTNFIPASDDGSTGAEYIVSDISITEGETYEYSLWEQEFSNSQPTEPEKSLVIEAIPESVSTELVGGSGNTSSTTSTPVGNSTATAEAGATVTATTTANATSPPTATVLATSTPQGEASFTPTAVGSDSNNGEDGEPDSTATPTAVNPEVVNPETEESAPIEIVPEPTSPQSSTGVVEASELPQDDTYPEPGQEDEENGQEYVPPPTNTPFPISDQNIQPIGEGIESPEIQPESGGQAIEQVDSDEISRNRLILWGGFLASLLFFIAVVFGSILMYRQRNISG